MDPLTENPLTTKCGADSCNVGGQTKNDQRSQIASLQAQIRATSAAVQDLASSLASKVDESVSKRAGLIYDTVVSEFATTSFVRECVVTLGQDFYLLVASLRARALSKIPCPIWRRY